MDEAILQRAESVVALAAKARAAIGQVVFGQEEVVELALTSVLAGGHALLVGVPGLAKTKLVDTMGVV
ncbi:MAG: AAA family ATPase, partial [Hyphomicrobiales bacterium]|nr:AAA family ATPase [Hyphomicrobiales bacterium]